MVDRKNCSNKLELLYRELEKRADGLLTSEDDLKAHGCTITDQRKIIDCVICFDKHMNDDGKRYGAYHFIAKRSLHNIGNKKDILISATWLEDVMEYRKRYIGEDEHMIITVFYNDFYFFFDVDRLKSTYNLATRTVRDKYIKNIPCRDPQTGIKVMNRVIMLPIAWAEKYGYMTKKKERDAIYMGVQDTDKHDECDTTWTDGVNGTGISPLI